MQYAPVIVSRLDTMIMSSLNEVSRDLLPKLSVCEDGSFRIRQTHLRHAGCDWISNFKKKEKFLFQLRHVNLLSNDIALHNK